MLALYESCPSLFFSHAHAWQGAHCRPLLSFGQFTPLEYLKNNNDPHHANGGGFYFLYFDIKQKGCLFLNN